jgi:DNA-binding winged helix-turn-helix (wHTH) protein/lipopolysaccharide biosynthesis regulator YciM
VADWADEVYDFGDFQLNVGERTLEYRPKGERIAIPEKAFQTLVHLVRNSGTLVTRDVILATVWPGVLVEEGNIGKAIHAIRRALGDRSGKRTYVETVPKHGYRFTTEVTSIGKTIAAPSPAASSLKAASPARSPAYDLYIRGKVKTGGENLDDINEAIALLEAAVRLDPSCAGAYAQLARAYSTRSFKFASQDEGRRLRENADVALAKALDLEPNLAEAHFARGVILWTKAKGFPHEQAIRAFQKALELDPDADETHHQLSMVYSHVGLLDEAQRHVARAIDLNPNNTMARFRVGVYTAWQCRFEDALTVLKTVPADVSPFLVDRVRAEVYVQLGRPDKARPIVDAYLARHPNDEGGSLTGVRALLLAKAGETRESRRTIAQAIELGTGFGHFHHTAYNIAATYAVLLQPDEAVNWVEAAADDGFPCYPYFARDPNLDVLREFPPFVNLMSQVQKQWRHFKRIRSANV